MITIKFSILLNEKKDLFTASNDIQSIFNRVIILADAAHSFGASYKGEVSGSVADFTSFSFHAVKNLTTSEGGALTWRSLGEDVDNQIYKLINTLSLHGQTKDALSKNQLGAWEYDIISPAYKCNMTDIQAAIGLAQLDRYQNLLLKRKELILRYQSALDKRISQIEHFSLKGNSSGHLLLVRIPEIDEKVRNKIIVKLAEQGIASNVHYKPLPMLQAYKKMGFNIENFPNAYNQFVNEITLPLNSLLSLEDVDYISEHLNSILEEELS